MAASLFEIVQSPSLGNVVVELGSVLGPLWIAVLVGLLVGWVWKPKWADSAGLLVQPICGFGFNSFSLLNSLKVQLPDCITRKHDERAAPEEILTVNSENNSSQSNRDEPVVTTEDLEHLCQLLEVKDGGPAWIHMMDRSTPTMNYQAWRRDPETAPPQYRSRTVFEDATPELVRDFFWDDEFRANWDDMLIYSATLEECPVTGTMMVHWIRKFPFFCSDREYMIGRRIWESGRSYYCVTKGVPYASLPRRNKPRRVDLYYSSWCIRAVESKRDGQLTACEVLLFHHEDMGIPWEIAKLGVRQGMWGAVKKIEPGLRAYQAARKSGAQLSHCAFMAQIINKIDATYLASLESESLDTDIQSSEEKPWGRNIPKLLIVGGAVALACSLDRGLLTKAVIFGVARRFGKFGRRL
ncbi:hypothetical protein AMTRI_Chr09g18210 [Amborella trichopoda]